MDNIGKSLLEIRDGESPEAHQKRIKRTIDLIKATFGTSEGKELMKELLLASPPLAPRFGAGRTSEEAAFQDGEKHFLGFLLMHSGLR